MSVTDTPVDNGVNVQALLDARNALSEAPEAYATFQRKEDGAVKVVFQP